MEECRDERNGIPVAFIEGTKQKCIFIYKVICILARLAVIFTHLVYYLQEVGPFGAVKVVPVSGPEKLSITLD